MSRLYLSESGRVIPTQCEELTVFRRARKQLELPGTEAPATLYLLARSYGESAGRLHLSVNGTELTPIDPAATSTYGWYAVQVQPAALREGANTIELWAELSVSLCFHLEHCLQQSQDEHSFVLLRWGRYV